MFTKISNKGVVPVVNLAQAKSQLNLIDTDATEEAHIQLLIDTATELAESYTNRLFNTATVELLISGHQSFFVPYGEVNTVDTVEVTGDPKTFTFEPITQILSIDDGQIFIDDKVKVTFTAGYAIPPNAAKMGILMILSSLYENREDSVIGASVADIPLNSMQVLNSIKIASI